MRVYGKEGGLLSLIAGVRKRLWFQRDPPFLTQRPRRCGTRTIEEEEGILEVVASNVDESPFADFWMVLMR